MNAPLFEKKRAPRNRTLTLTQSDRDALAKMLVSPAAFEPSMADSLILGDCLEIAPRLVARSVDLLFLDPPYNLNKRFHARPEAERNRLHLRGLAHVRVDLYGDDRAFNRQKPDYVGA